LIVENYCFVANLGDSQAIVTYTDFAGTVVYKLTREHTIDDEKEEERIYRFGG